MERKTSETIPVNSFYAPEIRLRLGEFDLGGVLYHANYFHVLETVRERLLESAGMPYPSIVKAGAHLVLSGAEIKFLKPITYGMKVDAYCWTTEITRISFCCNYSLLESSSGKDLCRAITRHAYVVKKIDQFLPSRLPDKLREVVLKFSR